MLFDLKGKRRRAVQGTYLTLAVLMGAGLVLFGIGGNVNGGLGDLFNGGGGSNKGNELVQKRIDTAEKQLQVNPRNPVALAAIIRGHYQLATASADPNTGEFDSDGRKELQQSAQAWQRYLGTQPKKPDLGLARLMVQAYAGLAQGVPKDQAAATRYWTGAADAEELIAQGQPTPENYTNLVQLATLAGQTRKADLAGQKAVELAPKGQKSDVKQQVQQAKSAAASQAAGGASPSTGTGP